jgi:hypothetical protein
LGFVLKITEIAQIFWLHFVCSKSNVLILTIMGWASNNILGDFSLTHLVTLIGGMAKWALRPSPEQKILGSNPVRVYGLRS